VQADVAALDRAAPELPHLGVSGEFRVPPQRRQEFLTELRATLENLFARYSGSEGDAFKLALACYPRPPEEARE
jgi:hypothetical protein